MVNDRYYNTFREKKIDKEGKKRHHMGIVENHDAIQKKGTLNSLSDTPTSRETQNVNEDSSTGLKSEYTCSDYLS